MAKRRRYAWRRECDLAEQVVRWLRDHGWTVWQEVAGADIVARDAAGLLWAIECKRSFSLKVLSQADGHRAGCHRCSIAIPAAFPDAEERFGQRVARRFGIGILRVARPDAAGRSAVREALRPECRATVDDRFAAWLVDRAQDHAAAGSPAAAAWTPFKETVCRLQAWLAEQPAARPMSEAIAAIDHHYASDAVAGAQLRRIITDGGIDGIVISKQGHRWQIAASSP